MSIWQTKDTIPIEQTEKAISSTNGLSYTAGQVIDIYIPPTTRFIIGKDSYLEFDVEIALPSNTAGQLIRLQLDGETGAQCLVRTLSVFAGNKQTLLEQIVAYNTMVSIKYDYETNDTLKGKRTVEGATQSIADLRGSLGTMETSLNNFKSNPYYKKVANATTAVEFNTATYYQKARITMPIHSGIFGSEKVFPCVHTNGITLSLELENNTNVFRMLDSVSQNRRIRANPLVNGFNGVGGTVATGNAITEIFVEPRNSNFSVENFPFVVGQTFKVVSVDYVAAPMPVSTITQIEVNTAYIKITFTSVVNTAELDPGDEYYLVDASVESSATFNPSYTVSKVNLVVKEVNMGDMYLKDMDDCIKGGGLIEIDVNAVTNYQFSTLASDRVANVRIPVMNSRCRSVLACGVDSSRYATKDAISATGTYNISTATADKTLNSCRTGLEGLSDQLSEYNWFINGRLQPSRPINVSKISNKLSISAQHIVELEKALASSSFIQPLSFEAYNRNFVIGRTLGIQDNMVYDARNKDFNLQLNYNETEVPTKNKLWNCYVFHVRRIVIKNESVSVVP
jgi:hypothetical protein